MINVKKNNLIMKIIISLLFIGFISNSTLNWKEIDDGMYVAEYHSPIKSSHDNSIITILKIDPNKFNLKIYSTNAFPTAEDWVKENDLLAVIGVDL